MLRPGDVVADTWRIIDRLGAGGMGTVWRAEDVRSGAIVAVKTITGAGAFDPELVGRFEREAVLAAKVDAGGGVARVHALRRLDQGVVMVQELVEGQDLGRLLREPGVDRARLVRLVGAVARTLARIHAAGVVHRDVKPSNILVRAADDTPVLVDFGLAWSSEVSRLTTSGVVLGTVSYMAPEQVNSASTAHAPSVDVHALGAVLYEALTGRPPRVGGGLGVLAELASGSPPPAPRNLDPSIDPALEALVMQALAFEPAQRPTAAALADALAAWSPVTATRSRGRRGVLFAAGASALALAALGVSATVDARREARAVRARETFAEYERWEEVAAAIPFTGEGPTAADLEARIAALKDAAGALDGPGAHERAWPVLSRAEQLGQQWALVRAGRLERQALTPGGRLAWAMKLPPADPRRLDTAAELAPAWRVLLDERLRGGQTLDPLAEVGRHVDARDHSEAIERTCDVWAERLRSAFVRGAELEVLEELRRALELVAGATVAPRLALVLDEQCVPAVLELQAQLPTGKFGERFVERGLRLTRYAEAVRALPGGRAGDDLVRVLAGFVVEHDPSDPTYAEVLVATVRLGAARGGRPDAYWLGKRVVKSPTLESLRALAAKNDGAAEFLLATPHVQGRFEDTSAEEASAALAHLERALARAGDLSPRHRAEAIVLAAGLNARLLPPRTTPDATARVERALRDAREAASPWVFLRFVAVRELAALLARSGREEERLASCLDQLERLRNAPTDDEVAEASRQTMAIMQRTIDMAPPDAWRRGPFVDAVASVAAEADVALARAWLLHAWDALGPLADEPELADDLRRLRAAAER